MTPTKIIVPTLKTTYKRKVEKDLAEKIDPKLLISHKILLESMGRKEMS